ncbi:MAG TPA: AsmA-like C-terminal region-containing protein, partial [Pirellulales bacterium]|nr:AsmA-like C-terminal region-containing protein [Pirellulales bacterium]
HSPSNPAGRGTISGVVSISGRNVTSARDLNARMGVKLRDVQGLPGSHAAHAHTSGALGGATKFSCGELRAGLSRGVLRIERLSLEGQKTQLYATGTATVGGRLDLQVTVDTGLLDSSSQSVVTLATQLALVAVPPLGLVLEANKFLSDQVVHLHVTGNFRGPSVRVLPLPLLGEEAVRFFMLQSPPEP